MWRTLPHQSMHPPPQDLCASHVAMMRAMSISVFRKFLDDWLRFSQLCTKAAVTSFLTTPGNIVLSSDISWPHWGLPDPLKLENSAKSDITFAQGLTLFLLEGVFKIVIGAI